MVTKACFLELLMIDMSKAIKALLLRCLIPQEDCKVLGLGSPFLPQHFTSGQVLVYMVLLNNPIFVLGHKHLQNDGL